MLIGIDEEKVRQAMKRDYEDIDKFYLRYDHNKGWDLLGLVGVKVVLLGEITNKLKLRTMIEDVPVVLKGNGYVIKHYKKVAPNKWAVFRENNVHPIVSNMKLDWAILYVKRKGGGYFCLQ